MKFYTIDKLVEWLEKNASLETKITNDYTVGELICNLDEIADRIWSAMEEDV